MTVQHTHTPADCQILHASKGRMTPSPSPPLNVHPSYLCRARADQLVLTVLEHCVLVAAAGAMTSERYANLRAQHHGI